MFSFTITFAGKGSWREFEVGAREAGESMK